MVGGKNTSRGAPDETKNTKAQAHVTVLYALLLAYGRKRFVCFLTRPSPILQRGEPRNAQRSLSERTFPYPSPGAVAGRHSTVCNLMRCSAKYHSKP